ncbi:unnamed protein product [Rotaria sordida]|uniref:Uncharacterized protein n=1 Tax=Rotaria sordida TaxID=392033 RepID=A0A814UL90_9BILA|nr:unnamed protein product [Rotaria sordida]CAF1445986.1 unnamed protein product [Rotaria sordida]CAF4068449.1 unnamed protein product [Rotaria sordida]CAF4145958.1 unnamed protein product [Rotaria sordida]
MLPKLTYEELNKTEPNGSTALHTATFNGHLNIVQLLLENGCARTTLNRYGNTAFQEAKTSEMRSLFDRSNSQRFIDENSTESFKVVDMDKDNVNMKDGVPDNWFKGYTNSKNAHESNFMTALARAPTVVKKFALQQMEQENQEHLASQVECNVGGMDAHTRTRARSLLHEFNIKKSIVNLLTLYTMETPFYGALQHNCESFTVLLYMHLSELKSRAYKGYAYRGGKMTNDDIQAYRWALRQKERILETRTVQSMTKNKKTAQGFASNSPSNKPISVLLIFDFREPCLTAIDLTRISEQLPQLSEYEAEEEVTLLPFTLFQVRDIKIDTTTGQYKITLENVPAKKKSLVSAWFDATM